MVFHIVVYAKKMFLKMLHAITPSGCPKRQNIIQKKTFPNS